MVPLAALWLPIVVSAVIVFVASSIMHMVLPYHKSDYKQLPDEDKVLSALRPLNLQRGLYVFPLLHSRKHEVAGDRRKVQAGTGRIPQYHAERSARHAEVPDLVVRVLSADWILRRLPRRPHPCGPVCTTWSSFAWSARRPS